MTSEQLAKAIGETIQSLESRIIGIGADQYDSGDIQKIEMKTLPEVAQDALEEIDDLLVYLAFLRISINRLKSTIDKFSPSELPPGELGANGRLKGA